MLLLSSANCRNTKESHALWMLELTSPILQAALKSETSVPEAFGSRIPSMASNFQEAAASMLEAARASSAQPASGSPAPPGPHAPPPLHSVPYLQLLQSLDSRPLHSLSTLSASPLPSASPPPSADRKNGERAEYPPVIIVGQTHPSRQGHGRACLHQCGVKDS